MQTVKIPDENRRKLDLKALKGILLGVDMESKAYKVYVPNSKKVLISRDVKFIEAKKTVNHNAIEISSDDGFAVQNTLKDEDNTEYKYNINEDSSLTEESNDITYQPTPVRRSSRPNKGIKPQRLIEQISIVMNDEQI